MFGSNTGSTGFTFGSNNNNNNALNNNNTAQPTTGGLFGNTNANTTTAAPATGLFGNTNTNTTAPATGLFGAKPAGTFGTNTTGTTTGGLFGTQNTAPTNMTSSTALGGTTGGLFGAKPLGTTTNTTTGGLFGAKPIGATAATTNNPIGGGLFGAQQSNTYANTTQQVPNTTNTFSNQPSFTWSNNSNNNAGLNTNNNINTNNMSGLPQTQTFFNNNNNINNANMLNNNNLNTLLPTSQSTIFALQQQQTSANYPQQIQEQVIKCKESWDPQSFKSKLRTFVYNKVNETEAMLYNKPANVIQEEWDLAQEHKPKEFNVIPIQLNGFEELNQRNQLQIQNVAQIRIILNEMLDKNVKLKQQHELETAARILKVSSKNQEIEKRILKLGSQLAILKNRGLPMSINEEKMWLQFKDLLKKSDDPAGLGKTNELWARLAVLKERAKNISDQLDRTLVIINDNGGSINECVSDSSNNSNNFTGKDSIHGKNNSTHVNSNNGTGNSNDLGNNPKIDKIAQIINNQQQGIQYLNTVLQKDHSIVDKLIK